MKSLSAYEILGVAETETDNGIFHSAYRRRVRVFHPDCGGTVEEFIELRKAYELLTQPELREKLGLLKLFKAPRLRIRTSWIRSFERLSDAGDEKESVEGHRWWV